MQAHYVQAALATFNICWQMFKYIVYLPRLMQLQLLQSQAYQSCSMTVASNWTDPGLYDLSNNSTTVNLITVFN